jgi:preprotein translocase subunit SecY
MAEEEFKDRLEAFLKRLPSVERPKGHVHFRRKLAWTVGILLIYFALTNVPLFGLAPGSLDIFASFRAFFAGEFGSLLTLGIGPIVTAGILMQLLVGAQVIKLDMTQERDKAIFMGLQKLMVFVMIVLEALPQIFGRFIQADAELAYSLGISPGFLTLLLFLQICVGGVLILFMDEVVSKWGIGSGVSLFILAGVSQALINGLFNFWDVRELTLGTGEILNPPVGLIPRWGWIATDPTASALARTDILFILGSHGGEIIALLATLAIFLIVVYFESARIEIPLAHAAVRGARGKFPVKLLYPSVIPIILIGTLTANIQMLGIVFASRFPFLGQYVNVGGDPIPVSGPVYYLSPINGPQDWIPFMVRQNPAWARLADWQIFLHLGLYAFILVAGAIMFAVFWIQTTGMGPSDVAKQIYRSGMQIPGFRRDRGAIERVMQRYIPKVTILGGALIGLLVLLGSLMGTIGGVSPTGLLLAVGIAHRLYEEIAKEQVMEMHPLIRRFIGAE